MQFTPETERYIYLLKKLNRAFNKGFGYAPHKPVLLISVFELIKKGVITTNKIFITPELVIAFKENWKKLVATNHKENFSLPFFHLRSELFWHLKTRDNFKDYITSSSSIKSFKRLTENVLYAEIDNSLFYLLQKEMNNAFFIALILDTYFEETKSNYYTTISSLSADIENQILNESPKEYTKQLNVLRASMDDDSFEEELFVRGGIFKKKIPEIYNYTCCVSEMKIQTTGERTFQMIDACHIIPFSVSNDDTIQNGISLCPNLHRAFDRGLITINQNFMVRVSPILKENDSTYSIWQFDGRMIQLPDSASWYPSIEALKWHNQKVFQL